MGLTLRSIALTFATIIGFSLHAHVIYFREVWGVFLRKEEWFSGSSDCRQVVGIVPVVGIVAGWSQVVGIVPKYLKLFLNNWDCPQVIGIVPK